VGGPPGRWLQPAGHVFAALAQGPFVSQRVVLADVVSRTDHAQMLEELAELIGGGKVRPVVARRYPFAELPAAVAEQERGHTAGKVVVTL